MPRTTLTLTLAVAASLAAAGLTHAQTVSFRLSDAQFDSGVAVGQVGTGSVLVDALVPGDAVDGVIIGAVALEAVGDIDLTGFEAPTENAAFPGGGINFREDFRDRPDLVLVTLNDNFASDPVSFSGGEAFGRVQFSYVASDSDQLVTLNVFTELGDTFLEFDDLNLGTVPGSETPSSFDFVIPAGVAVPEPTFALAGLGLAGLMLRRRA